MGAPKCAICTENYSAHDERRIPRILPCYHTLCHSCAQQILSNTCLKCPFCTKNVQIYDVNQLARNFALIQVIEEANTVPEDSTLRVLTEKEKADFFSFLNDTSNAHARKQATLKERNAALMEQSACWKRQSREFEERHQIITRSFAHLRSQLNELEKSFKRKHVNLCADQLKYCLEKFTRMEDEKKGLEGCKQELLRVLIPEKPVTYSDRLKVEEIARKIKEIRLTEPVTLHDFGSIDISKQLPKFTNETNLEFERNLKLYEFGHPAINDFHVWLLFNSTGRRCTGGDAAKLVYDYGNRIFHLETRTSADKYETFSTLNYLIIFVWGEKLSEFKEFSYILKYATSRDLLIVRDAPCGQNKAFEMALKEYILKRINGTTVLRDFIYVDPTDFRPLMDVLMQLY
ncbi:unnamed protein product [Caenorhabditis sp. 36 PRJEB53466]|nr:unnamed protein product [Caenorhabditis sp. 36 PRJEB53466]